ncbi:MAG: tRNA-dihydrouridine synthase family protein [Anaerolineales bacterium]|nr:tRNA-dihydrouridine synthase family protein [Anaerolineales bacterium]
MVTQEKALFYVGNVPVDGDVILSPMAGYSDVPYRALCRTYGSAMNYTEFVPIDALLGRRNPFWNKLDFQPDEKPIVFQIFGNNAQNFLTAALRIQKLNPDIIDINMGCSTRKVSGRGAGVGMMPQPELVRDTFSLLTKHLRVPVTGKIRLGWDDDQRNYADIARIMEDNGAALIAMHARTKVQKYGGEADWDEIARLRELVSVPVIGNGDVQTPADIDRMKTHTGCNAVMIGRAAIGNPWIFARRDKADLTFTEIAQGIRLHLREMLAYYGDPFGLIQFRKHFKKYVEDFVLPAEQVDAMVRTADSGEFFALLTAMETAVSHPS